VNKKKNQEPSSDELERYGVWVHPPQADEITEQESSDSEEPVLTIDDLETDIKNDDPFQVFSQESETSGKASGETSEINHKVDNLANEVSTLRQELKEVRNFMQTIKNTQSSTETVEQPKEGFFAQEEVNNQPIALTHSELGNILRTSDITEEASTETTTSTLVDSISPDEPETIQAFTSESDQSQDILMEEKANTSTKDDQMFTSESDYPQDILIEEKTNTDSEDNIDLSSISEPLPQDSTLESATSISLEGIPESLPINQIEIEEEASQKESSEPLSDPTSLSLDSLSFDNEELEQNIILEENNEEEIDLLKPQTDTATKEEELLIPSPEELNINVNEFDIPGSTSIQSDSSTQNQTSTLDHDISEDMRTLITLIKKLMNTIAAQEREQFIHTPEWNTLQRISKRIDPTAESGS